METLPVELYGYIFSFLSPKDRVTSREVCTIFESQINRQNLVVCRLENNLKKSHSIEKKLSIDIILIANCNFTLYTDYKPTGIHPLFRVNNHQRDKCIDVNCRGEKLGNIYFSKQPHHSCNSYTKRKIPYCIYCFDKWGFFAKKNLQSDNAGN